MFTDNSSAVSFKQYKDANGQTWKRCVKGKYFDFFSYQGGTFVYAGSIDKMRGSIKSIHEQFIS